MIAVKREYSLTVDMIYELMKAAKVYDDNLFRLLMLCKIQPKKWAILSAIDDTGSKLGYAVVSIEQPIMLLHLICAKGFKSWVSEAEPQMVCWAKSLGCSQLRGRGRPGWKGFPHTWKLRSIEFVKEIS